MERNATESTVSLANLYARHYQKKYRAQNPERILQYRVNAAIALLLRLGYLVITPDGMKEGATNV